MVVHYTGYQIPVKWIIVLWQAELYRATASKLVGHSMLSGEIFLLINNATESCKRAHYAGSAAPDVPAAYPLLN
jgi:hypothetical protein